MSLFGLTRDKLRSMSEQELRERMLIPLFTAMGFQDVFHFHGGSQEQGKDIVMWKAEVLRDRVNYGVVAKADRITGRAAGKGSAAEVTFQVHQCLSSAYKDSRSLTERTIDRCIVVSSHEISKEAITAIKNGLANPSYEKLLEFIDGDRLWQLLETFLPRALILDRASALATSLEKLSPEFSVTATVAKGVTHFTISPQHDGNSGTALTVNAKLNFPDTAEAAAVRRAFEDHVRTGSPVRIPAQFVAELDIPVAVRSLLGDYPPLDIAIAPADQPYSIPFVLVVEAGETASQRGRFRVAQAGTDQLTLASEPQGPWRFTITADVRLKTLTFDATLVPDAGLNVHRLFDALSFQRALALGGTLTCTNEDSGLQIFRGTLAGGMIPSPDTALMRLVKSALVVQQATGIPISLPSGDIPWSDAEPLFQAADHLTRGSATGTVRELNITVTHEGAEHLLSRFTGADDPAVYFRREEVVEAFGVTIPLGPALYAVQGLRLSRDEEAKLRESLPALDSTEGHSVRLTAQVEENATVTYLCRSKEATGNSVPCSPDGGEVTEAS